jgi:hypothetical protein
MGSQGLGCGGNLGGVLGLLGKSLKDDDHELWKQLDSLFYLRNQMAHVADEPSLGRVKDMVVAARRAIEWLDAKTSFHVNPSDGQAGLAVGGRRAAP